MNECRKTMTVVEFNRIVTRSLLWGCKKKWKKNLANSSEISWARPFCLFLERSSALPKVFFVILGNFASQLAGQSWGFVERNTQFTGPIQFPFHSKPQPKSKPTNPTHAHTISSCQLPVAGLFTKPWTWRSRALPHGLLDLWAGRWMSGTPSFCVWDKTKQNKIKWS